MKKITVIFVFATFMLLGDPPQHVGRAWEILDQGLASKSAAKRVNAVHALRLVRDNPRAQEMVEQALGDPNAKVKAAAARSLGPMGAKPSIPKLKALLTDADPAVALAAAHSLLLLGERNAVYELDSEVLLGERKGADGFVRSQMKQLRDPKAVATMGAETGIGFVPFGSEGYEVFKRAHKDNTTPIRVAAAKELAADSDPKIDAALARACTDKKPAVRAAALFALAKRGDPGSLTVITPALEDKNDVVRDEAAAAVLRLSTNSNQQKEEVNDY